MRKPSSAVFTLIVFWTAYAIAAAWTVYVETPLLSRDLLLILAGYGALLALVTAAIVLRTVFSRSRATRTAAEAGR